MIIVFDVVAEYGTLATYIPQKHAEDHAEFARKFCRDGEWVKVQPRSVSELPSEPVYISGDVIGFQFARTRMGGRTCRRTVRSLLQRDDGTLVGFVTWHDRIVLVEHREWIHEARVDSAARWISISYH